jgi:hypothetical protein
MQVSGTVVNTSHELRYTWFFVMNCTDTNCVRKHCTKELVSNVNVKNKIVYVFLINYIFIAYERVVV